MRSFTRSILTTLIAASMLGLSSCGSTPPPPGPDHSRSPRIDYKPLVTIRNNSYKNIVLGLRGPETHFVSIPARTSRSVNLLSGSYKYAATAKNANITSGYMYFGTNRNYTWNLSLN